MLRKLYDWIIAYSSKPSAPWALALVAFAESSVFPVPPDVLQVPMTLARPDKAWRYALIATIASVLGGLVGYAIGALLYDSVGKFLIDLYGYGQKVDQFRAAYAHYGHWVILLKGLTPIPFKLVTITSGFANYSLFWFIVLSVITRGARFFLLAALLHYFGPSAREFIEKRLGLVTLGLLAVVVLGLVAAAYFI
ncbi:MULTISPECIES: YqaA family protein [Xanthobacter]|uniref:Cytochrome b561 n=1 Tax=Xanthobacter flavus TaxID=281 RepID=A0A9W6CR38_XANFL|nr:MULTISPECIES: YqaA family protein [Xanthobacter]MBN8916560.1 DedA family protein [Hyphomicrobiales bacterium]MDR6335652.1 membrane protein YqaA with SNARE-associated domain [Xanthobacter flavus]NMN59770.1 membrane protein YqaA with SNARE-associated domain [Xanthobacter sp. SG618]UDQ89882.1 DedA family protein [Xanthobacter autotrophicus]UJX46404.1 DedA family protein [Xanthobacter sp. YC-JY1]